MGAYDGFRQFYYYAGDTRVAVRNQAQFTSEVGYLFNDYLGSTGKRAEANGTLVNEQRYRAFGENRYGDLDRVRYQYTGIRGKWQITLPGYTTTGHATTTRSLVTLSSRIPSSPKQAKGRLLIGMRMSQTTQFNH
jgi:hypothetical protein